MDFRGRIYHAGVFDFHKHDFARSLIVFASDAPAFFEGHCEEYLKYIRMQLACAAAFKYKKFLSNNRAASWYQENLSTMSESDRSLINFVLQASDPFQFLAYVLSNERVSAIKRLCVLNRVPVTQDASASASQIMSYLLLNAEMGRLTNLLPSPDNEIRDIYCSLKD